MKKHTRKRILKDFPCLAHVGLGKKEIESATITVGRVDDRLRLSRASYSESGDGVHADLRSENRWFCGFTSVDPSVTDEKVEGMTLLEAESASVYAESEANVSDLLSLPKPPIVIIEVFQKCKEFNSPKTAILIYKT